MEILSFFADQEKSLAERQQVLVEIEAISQLGISFDIEVPEIYQNQDMVLLGKVLYIATSILARLQD